MIDIDDIQLEERNVYAATKWGVVVLVYSIFLSLFFHINTSIIANPYRELDYGIYAFASLLYISTWVIRIIVAVYTYNVAKRLNRPAVTWSIFGFIFPPITLIILGFQDYKVEDKNIKKMIDDVRLDLRAELVNIKSTQDLTSEEIDKTETELKEKYKQILRKNVTDYLATSKANSAKEDKLTGTIQFEEDTANSQVGDDWIKDASKCPACGASLGNNDTSCPDCGLSIK